MIPSVDDSINGTLAEWQVRRYHETMEPVHLALPADLAHDLAGLAAADGRSVSDEGVLLLRRAVAGRQLREVLTRCGSDLDPDQAMQIALDEQQAARRAR